MENVQNGQGSTGWAQLGGKGTALLEHFLLFI